MAGVAGEVLKSVRRLNRKLAGMSFSAPVSYVYNPAEYAAAPYQQYLERYGDGPRRVLFLGMNPGPFGMAQTGVPFGEISAVRDWMKIDGPVKRPRPEHPKRPIDGFACTRSEVSGQRLWGLFAERFGTAAKFFKDHFVINYCPLVFMEAGGRNVTPDKLPAAESAELYAACDRHLRELVELYRPEWLVGVGKFGAKRAVKSLAEADAPVIVDILHPSPASPAANRGWAPQATRQMIEHGIWTS